MSLEVVTVALSFFPTSDLIVTLPKNHVKPIRPLTLSIYNIPLSKTHMLPLANITLGVRVKELKNGISVASLLH